MANAKITGLPPATTPLSGTEEAEIVQGGVNKRVAISEFGGTPPTLQEVTDEGNVVEYGLETTFVKYKTSDDVFAEVVSDDDGNVNFVVQQAVDEKTLYYLKDPNAK